MCVIKKFIPLFCALSCFIQQVYSMYNGNPSAPMMPEEGLIFPHSWLSLKGGYEFDNVFNRKLKMQTHHLDAEHHKFSSRTQFGVITVGLGDRVEIYSGLGNGKATLSQQVEKMHIDYKTDAHFACTIGGRALFAYWDNLQVGLAASYLHFFPSLHSISIDDSSLVVGNAQMQYHEWQVGAGLSYHMKWLFPYIGAAYSNVQAKFLHLNSLKFLFHKSDFTLDSQKHYGVFVGCGFSPEKGVSVNAEGRFIDETAFVISADIRF
jgi:opacity protein-like surface antigen